MSTPPKTPHPIESFDPKLVAAFTLGSRKRVEIKLKTKREAHRLQMRLNMLRRRALDLGRHEHKIFAKVRVSLLFGEKIGLEKRSPKDMTQPAWIVLQPHDSEFTEALAAAGITDAEGVALLPETEAPEISETEEAGFGGLISELGKK